MNNSSGTSATTSVTKGSDSINTGMRMPADQGEVLDSVNLVTDSIDRTKSVEPAANCFDCELCEPPHRIMI